MMFIDIHTHGRKLDATAVSVMSRNVNEWEAMEEGNPRLAYSVGIHPWSVSPDWRCHIPALERAAAHPQVLMIGECGLDKAVDGYDLAWQEDVFRWHVSLSERIGKPLVVHCVKACDVLLKVKKEMNPRQMWLVHGFRGKKEQARQLTGHGIELSFGCRFNADALYEAYSGGKMWLETDDGDMGIKDVYGAASESLNCTVNELAAHLRDKFSRVFQGSACTF